MSAQTQGSHGASESEQTRERPGATAATLLTASEVAQRWQVATAHVHRLAREGRLPVVRLGRYVRFELAAIEQFERTGGTDDRRAR